MNNKNSKKYKFKSWDDAFKGMVPAARQQSVRVADYTQVLFERVCATDYYTKGSIKRPYLTSDYFETAYKCGLYHQIGKSVLPEGLQIWKNDFTEEEKRYYRRYTVEGKNLVALLQGEDEDEVSISGMMIREACEQHMERWNGAGYPAGRTGEDISLIGQIVGLAREFDSLVCGTKSETPFEDTIDVLIAKKGSMYSAELISVLKAARGELRAIYKKYIQYTKTLPKTVPLVDKRAERPFGLKYKPFAETETSLKMYEAIPWFGAVQDKPEETETLKEVEALLARTGLLMDISYYFLYEASDTIVRMENCQVAFEGMIVPMFEGFYKAEGQWEQIEKVFKDQGIDKKKLILTVPINILRKLELSIKNRLVEYIEQGLALALDEYRPDYVTLEQIRDIGFTHVRLATEMTLRSDCAKVIDELQNHGITVVMPNTTDLLFTEDQLIKDILMNEQ